MGEKWIYMTHPDFPDSPPVYTPEISYKKLHSRKGWKVAEVTPDTVEVVDMVPRNFSTKTESKPQKVAKPKPKK